MRRWWPAGLLVAAAVAGALAVAWSPDGTRGGELWPVGLASGALLLAGRRAWVLGLALVPLTFAGYALFDAADRPWVFSLAYAVGMAAEVAVVWLVLTSGGRERARLRSFADLDRYASAAVLGAGVSAVVGYGGAVAGGLQEPALVALAVGASHLASQLTVLPFFLNPVTEQATAERWESWLAWAAVLVVTPLVFAADALPALGFLVMPLLVWGALRLGTWQALSQVAVVTVLAQAFYLSGNGPVTWVPRGVSNPADAATVLLQLFVVGCALVVIPLVLMVSLRRISDREAASERDKLASVVNAAQGVAIVGTDENGLITLFNPGAERLLGYSRAEMIGTSTRRLHTDEAVRAKAEELGCADDFAVVARTLVKPANHGTVMRFRRRDGEEREHLVTLTEQVDHRGRVSGYVSTSEDVTDQVRTQEALERALERMREVDALKDGFISTVSHELRTPVTSIVGYLELLEDGHFGPLAPRQRAAVARVQSNSNRLLVLIDDLLTLARMQGTTRSRGASDPVSLASVVESACTVAGPRPGASGVALTCDLSGDDVWVLGDRDALEGVLINLVGNAVKFTPDGGEVTVRLTVQGAHALVQVRDTGIGIPSDEVEMLFTRFFRSSLTLERAIPGSGLGLSIARGVVRAHGGDIEVESRVGQGTTFTVRLPLAPGWG